MTTASFWRPNGRNLNRLATSKDEDDWGVRPDPGFDIKISAKELNDLSDFQREQDIIRRPGAAAPSAEPKVEFKDRQLEAALDYLRGQIRNTTKVSKQ